MKKSKNPIQTENIEVKKFRAELWLGITNLILTAIVGIGITVFLNYRDEKVQEKIIALQAETARQANIAKIQVSTDCIVYNLCNEMLEVVNLGSAPAKNLKIVVVINDVNGGWVTAIDDINKFSIEKFPPTLNIKSQSTKVDVLFDNNSIKGNNAFELTVDNLPAGEKVQAILRLSPDLPVEQQTASRNITIYYDKWEAQTYFSYSIGNYFQKLYTVASFTVYASCDNCVVEPQDDSMIQVSSVGGMSTKNMNTVQESSGESWTASLTIEYKIPKGISVTPTTYPLYFKMTLLDDNGKVEFTEVSSPP